MRLWDIQSGKVKKIFYGEGREIRAVAFSKDMHQLYSIHYTGVIKMWDISTGKELLEMMLTGLV